MAEWLLDQIGVAAGAHTIDVACGPLDVLHLLAERVGPTGRVVGLDREPRMIEMAGEVTGERGLPVEFILLTRPTPSCRGRRSTRSTPAPFWSTSSTQTGSWPR
jgi:SAM-dependent methyltransferase